MTIDLQLIFSRIAGDRRLHARWLNTFSYLEYVGFRKIVKSQLASLMSAETLKHAVEEGRHALLLKKSAINTGGPEFDTYSPETLLCGDAAEAYFQSLDAAVSAAVQQTRLTYLYVTLLVEIRALDVYQKYQACAGAISMRALLAEEEHHLEAVRGELTAADPGFEDRLAEFKTIEEKLYRSYVSALVFELRREGEPARESAH